MHPVLRIFFLRIYKLFELIIALHKCYAAHKCWILKIDALQDVPFTSKSYLSFLGSFITRSDYKISRADIDLKY